jgi:hypothetical protein
MGRGEKSRANHGGSVYERRQATQPVANETRQGKGGLIQVKEYSQYRTQSADNGNDLIIDQ